MLMMTKIVTMTMEEEQLEDNTDDSDYDEENMKNDINDDADI